MLMALSYGTSTRLAYDWLRRFSEHLVRDQEVALLAAADAIERGEYRKDRG